MKTRDIVRKRMYSQHLWGSPFPSLEDVVRHLGALQSQDFAVAKWSVAQRACGLDNAAIDKAFADGVVLRTHVLRPTWHFVLPADIRWLLSLTAPRVNAACASYYRRLGLDAEVLGRTNAVLAKALEGGRQLTRKEIRGEFERAGITPSNMELAFMMMRAELDAVVCSGAPKGKQHTYALFDERVPELETLDRDEALAELTRRYFRGRGPATVKDYMWWSSLTSADARRGLHLIEFELVQEVVDGRTYWFAESSPRGRTPANAIDLVQVLDECIVSYRESKDLLHGPRDGRTPPDNLAFMHAVLLRGQLMGHWRPVTKRNAVTIATFFYRELEGSERKALDAAVERYGRFIGLPAAAVGDEEDER